LQVLTYLQPVGLTRPALKSNCCSRSWAATRPDREHFGGCSGS